LKAAFLVKIIFAILLGVIYSKYYTDRLTADTFEFFDDSKILYDLAFEHPLWFLQAIFGINDQASYLMPYYDTMHNWFNKVVLFNDYRFQIRLNALMRFISLGYYHVHAVFYCFLSFVGLTALLKLFVKALPELRRVLFAGVFFIPSVLFWGSGLLKDSLILFATGMALYFLNRLIQERKSATIFGALFFLLFLMMIKFHNFILLLPLFAAYLITSVYRKKTLLIFVSIVSVYYLILINLNLIMPGFGLMELLSNKQAEFVDLANDYHANSTIAINYLAPSEWNAIVNTPQALLHSFFRPYPFESKNLFILLAGFENLFFGLMMILVLLNFKIHKQAYPLFWVAVFYTLSLFELIGLVTPVMGAIVRYKIQALPFLFFLLIYLTDIEKLGSRYMTKSKQT
ncbi:MAG: hypothetical protein KBI42_11090, partial [Bacteroidia bacterium]|nr:hypothetical protein [Bacteroidia bacterium]